MKRNLILLLFASLGIGAGAQNAMETAGGSKVIAECQRLHSDGDHSAALTLIETVDAERLSGDEKQEFELLRALVAFENDYKRGCRLMEQYLDNYTNSSKKRLLNSYLAQGSYLDGNHEEACGLFGESDLDRLAPEKRERAELRYALALLGNGQDNEGMAILRDLMIESRRYSADAAFYLAVIDYDNDNNESAYRTFNSIKMDRKYNLEVPYYLAGIYLKMGMVEEARTEAERFIAAYGDRPQGMRMRQILGAAEFMDGNYARAAEVLGEYVGSTESPQRISCYQLGMSLLQEGESEEAKSMLERCIDVDDELAQNALLHIGILQSRLGDERGALVSYERSANMAFNDELREEAMYNYAICLHQTNYSAFGNHIKAFETFLNEYPGSKYASLVDDCLIDLYLSTEDCDNALRSIENINNPSAEILAAKQRILFNLGTQEFVIGNLRSSIDCMNRSLELAKYDRALEAEALYWKGEALCRVNEPDEAEAMLRKAVARGCENKAKAAYSLGYISFGKKDYGNARKEFAAFIDNAGNEAAELIGDAYNRIGDTYFYQREYAVAEKYYAKAMETSGASADYPLFRSAITMGLNDNNQGKIAALQKLVEEYPGSALLEQAYYEMGRAYIDCKEYGQAIAAYDKLIELAPVSQLARRAATEKAMIYNNMDDAENAIIAYKHIIESYPGSDEASIAAQDLKNLYIDKGRVNEFAQYAAKTEGMPKIEHSEMENLTYQAAERIYQRNDLPEAKIKFQEYLNSFPDGAYVLNCHYYIGVICFGEKDYKGAAEHLEEVVKFPNNRYSEEAMMYAAEAYYNSQEFDSAINSYKGVLSMTGDEARRQQVLMNIIHAAQLSGNNGELIDAAGALVKEEGINKQWKREAHYHRAKALIAIGSGSDAMDDLKELSKETRSKEGAEGKFLYADQLFKQGKYKECEREISDYMEKNTPHAYWLARSFVLLSDLYQAQGKKKEAKQYLISLKNSYKADDDIAGMIEKRMEELSK